VAISVCSYSVDNGTLGDVDDDVRITKVIIIGAHSYMLVYIYEGASVG
jgi:hypothetical protein